MKESIQIPLDELRDLIDDPIYEEHAGEWRWGTERFYVFEKDGKFWGVTLRYQPEMGIKDCNDEIQECVRMVSKKEIVTVTTWIPYESN